MDQVVHFIGEPGDDRLFGAAISVVHVYPGGPPKVNLKVSKTTRGYTWEISVQGAKSVDEALALAKDADAKLRAKYGEEG